MKYEKIETLVKLENTEIAKVIYKPLNINACAKILRANRFETANTHLAEAFNHAQVCGYANTIKFYDAFLEQSKGELNVVIIIELCEKGDLDRELRRRLSCKEQYTDSELYSIFKQFIHLLKELQFKKYCNRDIKPENIFISDDGTLKLGDFGEAKTEIQERNLTIRGSPFYLSPSLREA